MKRILRKIDSAGYRSVLVTASPHEFTDIPQKRDRVFIFSIRKDLWQERPMQAFVDSVERARARPRHYRDIILPKSAVKDLPSLQLSERVSNAIRGWKEIIGQICSDELYGQQLDIQYMQGTAKPSASDR